VPSDLDRLAGPTSVQPQSGPWTLPNLLSLLRLISIPVFLWLVLVKRADLAAAAVLVASGVTDYLDGRLARAWGQISRLGQLLDPVVDRIAVFWTVIAFVVRGILPVWVAVLLIGRDLLLGCCVPLLRRYGYGPLPVHFLGKAATFSLLFAFPLLLIAASGSPGTSLVLPLGWAFTGWGVALYLWAAGLYVVQVVRLIRDARAAERAGQ